ncbi:hypothetical protein FHQ18_09390 [Deferribacter autotrophicus]|uniref:Uncharacterized protein n=1 Tax=Deferribacter autotrophicus TaxID=500465 RepID=A0A5A8F6J4_9BACT|nr:hypothetical protein [Deferribacter autotrophicus]KAA0257546.1 hypothetical protein FHQ18_09390 [Deferribacter autotrophicus]
MNREELNEIIEIIASNGIYAGGKGFEIHKPKFKRIFELYYQLVCIRGRVQTLAINTKNRTIKGIQNFCSGCSNVKNKSIKKCFNIYTSADFERWYEKNHTLIFNKEGERKIQETKRALTI